MKPYVKSLFSELYNSIFVATPCVKHRAAQFFLCLSFIASCSTDVIVLLGEVKQNSRVRLHSAIQKRNALFNFAAV